MFRYVLCDCECECIGVFATLFIFTHRRNDKSQKPSHIDVKIPNNSSSITILHLHKNYDITNEREKKMAHCHGGAHVVHVLRCKWCKQKANSFLTFRHLLLFFACTQRTCCVSHSILYIYTYTCLPRLDKFVCGAFSAFRK